MKIIITAAILCAAICAQAVAATADDTKDVKKSDKKKADLAPKTVTVPRDAVPNPDGTTYTYTDKDGKKWLYAKTPFGVLKTAAADQPAAPPRDLSSARAIDKGDTVRFERPSPFGTMSWEKKKSELTNEERHILDAQTAKTEQK